MTVVVAYKYAANPQDASVAADGNVNWSRAKSTVSEYDPALSKGLARAVVVADGDAPTWNATKVASALAELVKGVDGADILLTGDSSVDEGARIVSALAAGYLGWPCFQGVASVAKTAEGYEITQNVPGGTRTVAVSGPVVVAAAKPFATAEVSPADVEVTVTGRAKPDSKARKNQILAGPDAAAQLIAALRSEGVL